jgi:hypothetical protein
MTMNKILIRAEYDEVSCSAVATHSDSGPIYRAKNGSPRFAAKCLADTLGFTLDSDSERTLSGDGTVFVWDAFSRANLHHG